MSQPDTAPPSGSRPPSLPPGLVLYQLSIGHYVSRALFVAAQLGVADALAAGPLDAEDLAAAARTTAALRRVVRLLASAGVFEEQEDGRFALTPAGDLLREDVPASMRAAVMLFAGTRIQESWKDLEWSVRTGKPAFRKDDPDADPFTAMANDPEAAANFDKAMAAFAPQTAVAVAAAYDFSGFARVADVGGGNGALLIGILRANPKLRGFVFDQPHVAERARANIAEAGLATACEVVGGSFFDRVPPRRRRLPAEARDPRLERRRRRRRSCATCAPRCRRAGSCCIVEGVYPERIERTSSAAARPPTTSTCWSSPAGGSARARSSATLYAASGFRLTRIVPTMAPVCVIEGEPA